MSFTDHNLADSARDRRYDRGVFIGKTGLEDRPACRFIVTIFSFTDPRVADARIRRKLDSSTAGNNPTDRALTEKNVVAMYHPRRLPCSKHDRMTWAFGQRSP